MALKKETQQIRYTEQIGVNRGGGFAAMADASITQANQLNSFYTATKGRPITNADIKTFVKNNW